MKIICVTLLVTAVISANKVLADPFECYECEGNDCYGNVKLVTCSADTVATPKPVTPTPQPSPTSRTDTKVLDSRSDADKSYACYKLYYNADNKTVMKKGCVDNKPQACDIAGEGAKGRLDVCLLCKETKCNSSAVLKLSVVSAVLTFLVLFFN